MTAVNISVCVFVIACVCVAYVCVCVCVPVKLWVDDGGRFGRATEYAARLDRFYKPAKYVM